MRRCVGQPTVGYYANHYSNKNFLLHRVQPGWDLWSVGSIGPDLVWGVGHGSVVQPDGVRIWRNRGDKGRGTSDFDGGDGRGSGGYKYLKVQYNVRVH